MDATAAGAGTGHRRLSQARRAANPSPGRTPGGGPRPGASARATRCVLARFGSPALIPATVLGRTWFRGERARALLAGCAAHSILPLSRPVSAAVGLLFLVTGHVETWPVAQGGSACDHQRSRRVPSLARRLDRDREGGADARRSPPSRVVLFDTSPDQVATIASPVLPHGYVRRLASLSVWPGDLQDRLGTGRPHPLDRPGLPRRCDSPRRRHARRDRSRGSGGLAWRARRPSLHDRRAAEPLRRHPRAGRKAHRVGVLPCPARVDARSHRRARASGGAVRPGIPRPHPRPPRDEHRRPRAYNANYVGGAITAA